MSASPCAPAGAGREVLRSATLGPACGLPGVCDGCGAGRRACALLSLGPPGPQLSVLAARAGFGGHTASPATAPSPAGSPQPVL